MADLKETENKRFFSISVPILLDTLAKTLQMVILVLVSIMRPLRGSQEIKKLRIAWKRLSGLMSHSDLKQN